MTQVVRHKRGDTLGWRITGTDSDTDRDLAGVTVAAQIRRVSLELIASLVCTVPDVTGNVAVSVASAAAGVQAAWPIGDHECDVKWSLDGEVFRSQTFRVQIVREVTA